jgi:hypothetical protein
MSNSIVGQALGRELRWLGRPLPAPACGSLPSHTCRGRPLASALPSGSSPAAPAQPPAQRPLPAPPRAAVVPLAAFDQCGGSGGLCGAKCADAAWAGTSGCPSGTACTRSAPGPAPARPWLAPPASLLPGGARPRARSCTRPAAPCRGRGRQRCHRGCVALARARNRPADPPHDTGVRVGCPSTTGSASLLPAPPHPHPSPPHVSARALLLGCSSAPGARAMPASALNKLPGGSIRAGGCGLA